MERLVNLVLSFASRQMIKAGPSDGQCGPFLSSEASDNQIDAMQTGKCQTQFGPSAGSWSSF